MCPRGPLPSILNGMIGRDKITSQISAVRRLSVIPSAHDLRVFEVIETICCQEDTGGPQPVVQARKRGTCE
jgi:hypothetical protein